MQCFQSQEWLMNVQQKSKEWNVSEQDVVNACKKSKNEFLIFLIAKGITEQRMRSLYYQYADMKSNELQLNTPAQPLPRILNPFHKHLKWWATSHHPVAQNAQKTIAELLNTSPQPPMNIPEFMSFARFASARPQWDDSKQSFVFFRDHPCCIGKNILIQRRQLAGNCFIHGPIVIHYYLQCMQFADPKPVDIRNFVKCHLDRENLSKLITRVGGGSSRDVLKTLVGPRVRIFPCAFNDNDDEIEKHLKKYGPGLITGFLVESHFHTHQISHQGYYHTPALGSHSMVLVGVRKEHGKTWILIQNWWMTKQFCEIDSAYFEMSNASILFCKGDISRDQFVTFSNPYDEAGLDAQEDTVDENF